MFYVAVDVFSKLKARKWPNPSWVAEKIIEIVDAFFEHYKYIAKLFDDLPAPADRALDAILGRIAAWMRDEASHGCLFHGAVASAPGDGELRALLERHKTEIAERTATAARLTGREAEISFILEGLAQSWPLQGELALKTAKTLLGTLKEKQLSLAV